MMIMESKGNLKKFYLLHVQQNTTWLFCIQGKQGLSIPEWWKVCISHHGWHEFRKHSSLQVASDRAVQVLPHLREVTTKAEEIPQGFILMPWNTCIFSSEEGQVTNSASSFTVNSIEHKLKRNTCYISSYISMDTDITNILPFLCKNNCIVDILIFERQLDSGISTELRPAFRSAKITINMEK